MTAPDPAAELREAADLSGWLGERIYISFCSAPGPFRLGSESFRTATLEEGRDLGYDDDDPAILIRRESDGAYFEAEIEAAVTRAQSARNPELEST